MPSQRPLPRASVSSLVKWVFSVDFFPLTVVKLRDCQSTNNLAVGEQKQVPDISLQSEVCPDLGEARPSPLSGQALPQGSPAVHPWSQGPITD